MSPLNRVTGANKILSTQRTQSCCFSVKTSYPKIGMRQSEELMRFKLAGLEIFTPQVNAYLGDHSSSLAYPNLSIYKIKL